MRLPVSRSSVRANKYCGSTGCVVAIANLSTMHSPSLLLGRNVIAEPCACNRMCSLCVLGLFLGFHKGCAVPPGSFDFVHECKRWWKPTENSKGRNNGVRGVHAHMRILQKSKTKNGQGPSCKAPAAVKQFGERLRRGLGEIQARARDDWVTRGGDLEQTETGPGEPGRTNGGTKVIWQTMNKIRMGSGDHPNIAET